MLATFAGGCFWCTEAVFQRLKGVTTVTPGYIGGTTKNPSYYDVCSGNTGHAESLEIEFDPAVISYLQLLEVFFATHNPTTLNQQDYDKGTEYRSAIFYHDQKQKDEAEQMIKEKQSDFPDPIVTTLEPALEFYPAEKEHRDFYENNPNQPYCQIIIDPKIQKLMTKFSSLTK